RPRAGSPATRATQVEGFDKLPEQDEVGRPCRRSGADVPGEYRQRRVGSSGVPASSVFGPSRGDAFKDSFVLPDKASEKLEGIGDGDLQSPARFLRPLEEPIELFRARETFE